MDRKRAKRRSRSKPIPLHFQKRNNISLSQCLQAASNQRRNRELLQTNRALASALEEAQMIASSNHGMLQKYVRDSNQILLAKKKLKDMVSTIQILVGDLNEVLTCLDETYSTGVKRPFNDDMRMRIQVPELSDIEESVRSSSGGNYNNKIVNNEGYSDENKESPIKEVTAGLSFQIDSLLAKINHSPKFISNNFDQAENKSKTAEIAASSGSVLDSSITEIYNVKQFLSDKDKAKSLLNADDIAEAQTPPTPQLDLPKWERIRFSPAKVDCNKLITDIQQNSACSSKSKIPIRRQNLFNEKNLSPDLPVAPNFENRRETFVIKNNLDSDQIDCLLSSGRRETFTLKEISGEVESQNKKLHSNENCFKPICLPAPIFKQTVKNSQENSSTELSTLQRSLNLCSDDQTKLINEDMELTEMIPSNDAIAKNFTFTNFCNPQEIEMSEIKDKSSPLKRHSPISPILKINAKSDLIKNVNGCNVISKPDTLVFNKIEESQNVNEKINKLEIENCQENFRRSSRTRSSKKSILENCQENFCRSSSTKPSRKSKILPQGNESFKQPSEPSNDMLNDVDIENNLNVDINHELLSKTQTNCSHTDENDKHNFQLSSSPTLVNNNAMKKSLRRASSINSKKSVVALNCTFSDSVSSDSDPDFIINIPKQQTAPRIPSRKSIQKNRRKPYTFKKVSKGRKSNPKPEEINVDILTDANMKTYDFSSASDEDITQEVKPSKKYLRKKAKSSKNKIEESTVAILEKDINLQYQNQHRKKRSLARRVSFANIKLTPKSSDEEGNSKTNEVRKSIPTMATSGIVEKVCITRPSILKTHKSQNLNNRENACSDVCPSLEKVIEINDEQLTFKSTSDSKKSLGSLPKKDELLNVENAKKSINLEDSKISKSIDEGKLSRSQQKTAKRSNKVDLKEVCCEKEVNEIDNFKKVKNSKSGFLKNSELKNSNSLPNFPEKALQEASKSDSSVIKPFKEVDDGFSNNAEKSSSLDLEEKEIPKKRASSRKHSELVGLANKRSTKSKRTFSGVSERSSKKRFTGDDDFLEEIINVEINSEENQNLLIDSEPVKDLTMNELPKIHSRNDETCMGVQPSIVSNEMKNDVVEKDTFLSNANAALLEIQINKMSETKDKINDKPLKSSKPQKRGKSTKPRKRSNSKAKVDALTEQKNSPANNKENKSKSLSNGCIKKSISSLSTEPPETKISIAKDNLEDAEVISGGRSRRNRPTISLKEIPLNRKMRRE